MDIDEYVSNEEVAVVCWKILDVGIDYNRVVLNKRGFTSQALPDDAFDVYDKTFA